MILVVSLMVVGVARGETAAMMLEADLTAIREVPTLEHQPTGHVLVEVPSHSPQRVVGRGRRSEAASFGEQRTRNTAADEFEH